MRWQQTETGAGEREQPGWDAVGATARHTCAKGQVPCLASPSVQAAQNQAVIAQAHNKGGQQGWWVWDSLRGLRVPVGAASPP